MIAIRRIADRRAAIRQRVIYWTIDPKETSRYVRFKQRRKNVSNTLFAFEAPFIGLRLVAIKLQFEEREPTWMVLSTRTAIL